MKKYQFLYWIDELSSIDKLSVISAKTIVGACGKFIRGRQSVLSKLSIDYEVMIIETGKCVDVSDIESVKNYIR